jgi:protein-S-isoprenylcysteine O-methyltransferase Ste14
MDGQMEKEQEQVNTIENPAEQNVPAGVTESSAVSVESNESGTASLAEEEPKREFLYRYRGWVLGILSLILLLFEPADLELIMFLIFINIFILAFYLRVKARRVIGEHTRGDIQEADELVTWGAYARLRHPLYVSNAAFGISLIFLHLGLSLRVIPFIVVLVAFEAYLGKLDDRFLEKKFGDEWKIWAQQTPAFFPREFHRSGPMRSAREAFLSDHFTWLWMIMILLLIVVRKIAFMLWT